MKKYVAEILGTFVMVFCVTGASKAQSTFVGGLFPTIDHSGTITKHLDYSFYYFGAIPLVNFNNPDISKDANFLLLYSEQALTFNVNKHLSFTGSYVVHNRTTDETPYTHRLRYLIGLDFPIKSKKNNLYFTAYEEAFFNTFKNAGAVYGENWAYAAIGVKLNDKNKIETGPLYITWNTGGNNWFHQYYLQLTWVSHLDFTKPKPTK